MALFFERLFYDVNTIQKDANCKSKYHILIFISFLGKAITLSDFFAESACF